MPDPTPSPSATLAGGGTRWTPGGASSPAPSPSPAGAASPNPLPSGTGFPITGTTTGSKSVPTYVYYDPVTGRLAHTAGPTRKPTKLPDHPLPYTSLDSKTKAWLKDIVDATTRPSGAKWGTAVDLWNYVQRQSKNGAGSVWEQLDTIEATAPRRTAKGSEAPSKSWFSGAQGDLSAVDSAAGDTGLVTDNTVSGPDGAGGAVAAPQPSTNTQVYKTITSFTPADAETLLTSALTNAIGREPTAGEIRHFLGKLRSAAKRNPSVSRTTTRNDGLGNTSTTTKQTPGFDSTSANVLADHVAEGGAFEKERKQNTANQMFNAFLSAVQSPVG